MKVQYDQNTRIVIVHGPRGCGKTRNRENLLKHFGAEIVIDNVQPYPSSKIIGHRGRRILVLTSASGDYLRYIQRQFENKGYLVEVFRYEDVSHHFEKVRPDLNEPQEKCSMRPSVTVVTNFSGPDIDLKSLRDEIPHDGVLVDWRGDFRAIAQATSWSARSTRHGVGRSLQGYRLLVTTSLTLADLRTLKTLSTLTGEGFDVNVYRGGTTEPLKLKARDAEPEADPCLSVTVEDNGGVRLSIKYQSDYTIAPQHVLFVAQALLRAADMQLKEKNH